MANDPSNASTGPRITPADIQRQEFGVSRFGGYRMRDVDEFLDRLTESTEMLLQENERLRGGAAPIVGTSDLAEVDRQADEILQRARDEAARIVAAARSDQAGMSGPLDDTQRAAVDAFLGQERAFLQNLATLVQGHAESVKGMARRSRQQADLPAAAEDADVEATQPEPARDEPENISLPEATDEPGADEQEPGGSSAGPGGSGDETVIVEVPQPTTTSPERERPSDPSLKQLFWGDER